jgi:hypothetical protein
VGGGIDAGKKKDNYGIYKNEKKRSKSIEHHRNISTSIIMEDGRAPALCSRKTGRPWSGHGHYSAQRSRAQDYHSHFRIHPQCRLIQHATCNMQHATLKFCLCYWFLGGVCVLCVFMLPFVCRAQMANANGGVSAFCFLLLLCNYFSDMRHADVPILIRIIRGLSQLGLVCVLALVPCKITNKTQTQPQFHFAHAQNMAPLPIGPLLYKQEAKAVGSWGCCCLCAY